MKTKNNLSENVLKLILGIFMIALGGWFIYLIDNLLVYVIAAFYIFPEGVDIIKDITKNK